MDDERSRRTFHRKTIRQRYRRLFSHSRRYRLRNRQPALRTHPHRRIHRFHHTRYGKSCRIQNKRYISGNVLTGVKTDADGYIGAIHSQITVIPEGNNYDEFLGWASLNPHKYSTSHSYFSWLLGKKKKYTTMPE